jgi:hypothetical protein
MKAPLKPLYYGLSLRVLIEIILYLEHQKLVELAVELATNVARIHLVYSFLPHQPIGPRGQLLSDEAAQFHYLFQHCSY